jgi:hypothetical protein
MRQADESKGKLRSVGDLRLILSINPRICVAKDTCYIVYSIIIIYMFIKVQSPLYMINFILYFAILLL